MMSFFVLDGAGVVVEGFFVFLLSVKDYLMLT